MNYRYHRAARVVTVAEATRLCGNLSTVELATMKLVMQGYSSKEIAKLISRAPKTVEAARGRALEKLGAQNMVHAAVIATKAGLV